MAINLHSGLLNRRVVFQKPTISVNDEGGRETSFADEITTMAYVKEVKQNRATEPEGTTINDSKDFYVRYSAARLEINKDWLITYSGRSWNISEIEIINEAFDWLRFRAAAAGLITAMGSGGGSVVVGGGGVSTGGGTSSNTNYSDFTFDELNGVFVFSGGSGGGYVYASFKMVGNHSSIYINAEGSAYSSGPSPTNTLEGQTYFTPNDYSGGAGVWVRWRRQTSSGSALTAYNDKLLTIIRLARRWLSLKRQQDTNSYDLLPAFTHCVLYNIAGEISGTATNISELVTIWNSDPANEGFPIIETRTINSVVEVRIEPSADKLLYPIQKLKWTL